MSKNVFYLATWVTLTETSPKPGINFNTCVDFINLYSYLKFYTNFILSVDGSAASESLKYWVGIATWWQDDY